MFVLKSAAKVAESEGFLNALTYGDPLVNRLYVVFSLMWRRINTNIGFHDGQG